MEVLLAVLSCFFILTVVVSLVHNSYWIFRVMEYPRLQKLFLMIPVAVGWFWFHPFQNIFYAVCCIGLYASIFYIIYKIKPYTFLTAREMKAATPANGIPVKIFSANVYQCNDQYHVMLQQAKASDADIIFLLETNKAWEQAMTELETSHPYFLKEPLENTYGLLFYSRLPLVKAEVKYLVKKDIPSVDAIVQLPGGKKVQLYGLHPEPPVPNENLYSTAKDKELMKVALKVRDCKIPCIVFGDLNDVAWSYTTTLFRKTSELLDPRIGRGFYSTFSAKNWFMRFPLDYIFCSKDFGLSLMKRMPKNGSDHFAIVTELVYQPAFEDEQEAPEADAAELQEAKATAMQ